MVQTETIIDNQTGTEFTAFIGKNAQENWDLIDAASQNDIWFHLKDHPSPHIILKVDQGKPSRNVLKACCVFCKQYSKMKSMHKITIIYTEIKNITKGDAVGSVTTAKTKEIVI